MKIEIDITEEQAACLWDDVTWGGSHPRTIESIAQSYMTDRALLAVAHVPLSLLPGLLEKFRQANPPQAGGEAPPQPTQSHPDCECGSWDASWHGEAPDLRQYCCPACYQHRIQALAVANLPRT